MIISTGMSKDWKLKNIKFLRLPRKNNNHALCK